MEGNIYYLTLFHTLVEWLVGLARRCRVLGTGLGMAAYYRNNVRDLDDVEL